MMSGESRAVLKLSQDQDRIARDALHKILSENARLTYRIEQLDGSLSMRLTLPLRIVRSVWGDLRDRERRHRVYSRLSQIFKSARPLSYGSTIRQLIYLVRKRVNLGSPEKVNGKFSAQADKIYQAPIKPNSEVVRPLIVIIADLYITACVKYRVLQRKRQLECLGWRVLIVDGHRTPDCATDLITATAVIFFRLTLTPSIREAIRFARRLQIPTYWEVDDLIFNRVQYRLNDNLKYLSRVEQDHLLSDANLFEKCLLASGRGIASTSRLAEFMIEAGATDASVIENAIDDDTIAIIEDIKREALISPGESASIWLCFGTGSRARNADFAVAEAGILDAMAADPRLCIHLIGNISPSDALRAQGARVKFTRELSFKDYLRHLATSHLTIAPAQLTAFNDCKSAIKFVEASLLNVPIVCSPTRVMSELIDNGSNGFLAESRAEWCEAILKLCADSDLRARLGAAGFAKVQQRFSKEAILQQQVAPIFGSAARFGKRLPRVVTANVYFAPESFGGATLLVEALLPRIKALGFDLSVVTSDSRSSNEYLNAQRYDIDGMPIVAISTRQTLWTSNTQVGDIFGRWLEGWSADIVHLHAIQNLGLDLAQQCLSRGIPYVITLHDCWWLSEDLFITDDYGQYRYDQPDFDGPLSDRAQFLSARRRVMHDVLMNAAALLAPSETHKDTYVRNGIPENKITVSPNGIVAPQRPHRRRDPSAPLRLGYVGGVSEAKGWLILQDALHAIPRADWTCLIVDSSSNLGASSLTPADLSVGGKVKIVPGYSASTIDDFFNEIDVLLFPSQWAESYGLTVREALARDVWVITTTPGGQSEPITDGVNGTLLPIGGGAKPLSLAICDLVDKKSLFDNYVNPMKDKIATLEDQAEETARLYRSILAL